MNILVNLPEGFFQTKLLNPIWERLEKMGDVRKTSYNTDDEIKDDATWADVILMWCWPTITKEMITEGNKTKYIGQINANAKQVVICDELDVPMSEVRHAWSLAVAEMALGLTLSGLRKISDYHSAMRAGTETWDKLPNGLDPLERRLTGSTVGIVGLGRIGQIYRDFLKPFNAKVLAYDPFLPKEIADKLNVELVDLETLVSQADVTVLCAANVEGSKNLINEKLVNSFKKDSVLVNIGRSMLIDMPALEKRLEKKELIAMLDVFDKEPLEKNSSLRTLENAYLTPHRAGGLIESILDSLNWLLDDMDAALEGKTPKFPVSIKMMHCYG